jgi:ubiquinone/menaquinone biosynthesis C-methylase UbiE
MSISPGPAGTADTGSASRVSEYWAKQSEEARTSHSVWLNNNIVASHINRLMTGGTNQHWLFWTVEYYLGGQKFQGSLSICCGDGVHELSLYQTGKVHRVHGFDISEGAIAQAISRFKEANIPDENYHFEVCDANQLKLTGSFDLILSSGALHHVTNLEGLLSTVHNALTTDGYFVVVEYVGPNRFQWTDRQMSLINGVLQQLDLRYLKDGKRVELGRPPLSDFLAIDPSEAVRSKEILPLLKQYFTVEYLENFNGTILHQLYPLLNPELTNIGSSDFDSLLRVILFFEDILVREGVVSSDFAFAICRRRDNKDSGRVSERPGSTSGQYIGFIDQFDDESICGWAADTTDPHNSLDLDIYVDNDWKATVHSDVYRADLVIAGYGDGRKGFHFRLPNPIASSKSAVATLRVHRGGELVATKVKSASL